MAGRVVVLNGAPRAGKSSLAAALQADPDELWVGLGVDSSRGTTPPRAQPGAEHRLDGLPVLFVGVRCPLEVVRERRRATGLPPEGAARWQDAVHIREYDLELADGPPPTAFGRLATFRA